MERRRPLRDLAAARTSFQTGRVRTTLLLATGGTYNRIEGLPVVFGPTFELRPTAGSALKLDLRGILRTAGEDTRLSSDFGWQGRLEVNRVHYDPRVITLAELVKALERARTFRKVLEPAPAPAPPPAR